MVQEKVNTSKINKKMVTDITEKIRFIETVLFPQVKKKCLLIRPESRVYPNVEEVNQHLLSLTVSLNQLSSLIEDLIKNVKEAGFRPGENKDI